MDFFVWLIIGAGVIMLIAGLIDQPKATVGFLFTIWMLAAIGRLVVQAVAALGG